MVKRILSLFLCAVLVLGCAGCSRNKAVSPDGLTAGTYDASHPQFAELRKYYFDYFWKMQGLKNLTTNSEDKYNDEDVLLFTFACLDRKLGDSIYEGVTTARLNEVANKYLGHTITEFDTDVSMINDTDNKVYLRDFGTDPFGDLFVLQSLVVTKDGKHQGVFHRCNLPNGFWDDTEISDPFEKIINGEYGAFGNNIIVMPTRVVFDVLVDNETNQQYLKVTTIKEQI